MYTPPLAAEEFFNGLKQIAQLPPRHAGVLNPSPLLMSPSPAMLFLPLPAIFLTLRLLLLLLELLQQLGAPAVLGVPSQAPSFLRGVRNAADGAGVMAEEADARAAGSGVRAALADVFGLAGVAIGDEHPGSESCFIGSGGMV